MFRELGGFTLIDHRRRIILVAPPACASLRSRINAAPGIVDL
jgi:hypothetical protein